MNHSQMLENMFVPYEYEIVRLFFNCSDIFLFIDTNFPHAIAPHLRRDTIHTDGEEYRFKDSKTFYFHLPEDKLYGGQSYALVVFKHSEEEIINRFHKFMNLKAFL